MKREFPFGLPNGWFQAAYSDEVAVGQLVTLEYFGTELVLFRGDDGRARIFDAFCPHLGAHLGFGGRVVGNGVRCPFHAWEFDGEGRCARIPYAKRIPPKAEIRSWPVDEKNGLILVWFDKQGRPPSYEIPVVPEYESDEWTDYFRRDWVIRSRNQELAENIVDPVHFRFVHRTAEIPPTKAWIEDHVLRVHMDYPIAAGEEMQYGSIDAHCYGFGFGITRFEGIVDTTVVVSGTAIDEERVHNRLSFMVKKRESPEATEGLGKAFVAEIVRQFDEDIPIWENKTHWDRPVLCDGDGPIAVLRKWGEQFY
jgi:phenylpropionate dioxygenase-like ring-hydroxylating dioxygenase large terminal subunit